MKSRLLATLFAAIATAVSVAWAAGLFTRTTAPPGTIASDSITIQVGGEDTSRLLAEVTSFSAPGIAVIVSATLLFVAVGALLVELRRNREKGTDRAQTSRA